MILDTLAQAARERVERKKREVPPEEMRERALSLPKDTGFPFEAALRAPGVGVIAELKRASPSKGLIAGDFPYLEIAAQYERGGAAALSVLTEPDYFLGRDEYLVQIHRAVSLPLLRKDFTVDPYQIYEAKALGASAVLLICSLLDEDALRRYGELCDSLGLSALTEAHDEAEIRKALRAGARVVGVNNRNLKDFSVNPENCLSLRKLVPPGVLFVAESGIRTAGDMKKLRLSGVDAALVGETLMRSPDREKTLKELRGEAL